MQHSREQWQHKATQRGEQERYQRTQHARLTAPDNRTTQALTETQAHLRHLEAQLHGLVTVPKVDVVHVALQRFGEARLGLRAVSRVLTLLAVALGITKAPCPPAIINWVSRLSIVRLDAARTLRGVSLRQAPCTNGLIWMIDRSMALGSGKMVAVGALDAPHHHLVDDAPSLHHVPCIAVSVAESWTGEAMAEVLKRLIAQRGRPAASLKDGGSALHKAADLGALQGWASPCIDEISHAAANMLTHSYHHHPACERVLSACGRVSGKLQHTILACVAPPTVRPQARFMHGHRLCTWAERLLKLSPAGGAKDGSIFARLRACCDALPACKDLIRRFRADAQGVLECQKMLTTQGLCHDTLTPCQPLIAEMPSAPLRQERVASLAYELVTAKTGGLDQVGMPISSDAIASLFGVAKRHGVGQTQDAARSALRLPAFCGMPTREEAAQVGGIRVARPHEITGQLPSLTTQRREVRGHGKALESLARSQGEPPGERLPRPKNWPNHAAIANVSMDGENQYGPHLAPHQIPWVMENVGPPAMRDAALT